MAPYLNGNSIPLDIGSGSGYITACMAKMCKYAYGIEHIEELIPRSIESIKKTGAENFEIIKGDGRIGHEKQSPYDVIHVGVAFNPVFVDVLMKQLKKGALILPLELGFGQSLFSFTFDSDENEIKKHIIDVMFVPLN